MCLSIEKFEMSAVQRNFMFAFHEWGHLWSIGEKSILSSLNEILTRSNEWKRAALTEMAFKLTEKYSQVESWRRTVSENLATYSRQPTNFKCRPQTTCEGNLRLETTRLSLFMKIYDVSAWNWLGLRRIDEWLNTKVTKWNTHRTSSTCRLKFRFFREPSKLWRLPKDPKQSEILFQNLETVQTKTVAQSWSCPEYNTAS